MKSFKNLSNRSQSVESLPESVENSEIVYCKAKDCKLCDANIHLTDKSALNTDSQKSEKTKTDSLFKDKLKFRDIKKDSSFLKSFLLQGEEKTKKRKNNLTYDYTPSTKDADPTSTLQKQTDTYKTDSVSDRMNPESDSKTKSHKH